MENSTFSTSSSPLTTLPFSLLESICEHLSLCDFKRRSLFAFSLTSKRCCFATTRQRFKHICFTVRNGKKLRQDVKQWEEILGIDGRMRYVHRVKVAGYMSLVKENEADKKNEVDSAFQWKISTEEDEFETEHDEDDFFEPSRDLLEDPRIASPLVTHEEKEERNKEWLSFARFLEQISHLQDLIYACTHQIPMCILTSLHQYHPSTRLHVHTFSLRSLCHLKDRPHDIDPDEFVLITSPCLYSIVVLYSDYLSDGRVDYNEEAVLQMMATVASRLKFVRMWYRRFHSSTALQVASQTSRPSWQGFFADEPGDLSRHIESKGCLQKLMLTGWGVTSSSQLTAWSSRTDFSQLRSLEIKNCIRLVALRALTRIAEDGGLGSLHRLALSLSSLLFAEQSGMDEVASLLLQVLPPLEDLRLTGHVANSTFTMLLHSHGETLRKLQFIPHRGSHLQVEPHVISQHCIQELSKRCPNLRDVELLISRTISDEQEVSIYRTLGTLRWLKRVSLYLDCSQLIAYPISYLQPTHYDVRVQHRMRENLAKSAVDISLALAIFGKIFPTTNINPVQILKLRPFGGHMFDQYTSETDFANIVEWIARSWICTRGSGDGSGEVMVREMKTMGRQGVKHNRTERELKANIEDYKAGKLYKRLWGDIWPKVEGATGDWREDWRSFPLFSKEGENQ